MKRDFSKLDERYTPFFERGERVEVEVEEGYEMLMGYGCLTDGKKLRFWVGRSTGIRPIYLMILNRNSIGGCAVPSKGVKSIRGLGIYNGRRRK